MSAARPLGDMTPRPLAAMAQDLARARRGGAFGPEERVVAERVIAEVRRGGDAAVLRSVRRFDRKTARAGDLLADRATLRRIGRRAPRDVRAGLDLAYTRIRAFHDGQRPRATSERDGSGVIRLTPAPLGRVGALVPRGATAYPSTALMTGIPAQVAGVGEFVAASPMSADGEIDPALAYALTLVDVHALYRAGGAAAVAAFAYGTKTLVAVDKIVGPGNAYAAAAKWLVSADVGIDALQGPSELVVVASGDADASTIALDLLAQAEHGSGAFAALVSSDGALLGDVVTALTGGAAILRRRVFLYLRAGAVFSGTRSAVAFGDYVAGTNHCLPTGGTARWSSALRVEDFVRWTSRVELRGDLRRLTTAGAAIARHERMRYHAASMEARG